jgi:hypothetical protein
MALYAVEVLTGQRPGPYTDADAEHHAARGIARADRGARARRRGRPEH